MAYGFPTQQSSRTSFAPGNVFPPPRPASSMPAGLEPLKQDLISFDDTFNRDTAGLTVAATTTGAVLSPAAALVSRKPRTTSLLRKSLGGAALAFAATQVGLMASRANALQSLITRVQDETRNLRERFRFQRV